MNKLITIGALVVSSATFVWAQNAGSPPQQVEIKGSEHPELIPDISAYKVLLMNVGDSPSAPKWTDRRMYLEGSNLSEEEVDAVITRGIQFRSYYMGMLKRAKQIEAPYKKTPYSATQRYAPEVFPELDALEAEWRKTLEETVDSLKNDLGESSSRRILVRCRRTRVRSAPRVHCRPALPVLRLL